MVQNINERLLLITELLLKIAVGNYCYKIPHYDDKLEFDLLLKMTHCALDELRVSLHMRQFVVNDPKFHFCLHITLVLDKNYWIEDIIEYGASLPKLLHLSKGVSFITLLDVTSYTAWMQACKKLEEELHRSLIVRLDFQSKEIPTICFCTIASMRHSAKLLVTIYSLSNGNSATRHKYLNSYIEDYGTNLSATKLHSYILSNLDAPLPSIKELVKMFGSNEFYLKDSFRRLYQISIYKFYSDNRLKRAHLFVKETTMPLWEISDACGFGSYNNFSKAFRKHFGYSANSLRHTRV